VPWWGALQAPPANHVFLAIIVGVEIVSI